MDQRGHSNSNTNAMLGFLERGAVDTSSSSCSSSSVLRQRRARATKQYCVRSTRDRHLVREFFEGRLLGAGGADAKLEVGSGYLLLHLLDPSATDPTPRSPPWSPTNESVISPVAGSTMRAAMFPEASPEPPLTPRYSSLLTNEDAETIARFNAKSSVTTSKLLSEAQRVSDQYSAALQERNEMRRIEAASSPCRYEVANKLSLAKEDLSNTQALTRQKQMEIAGGYTTAKFKSSLSAVKKVIANEAPTENNNLTIQNDPPPVEKRESSVGEKQNMRSIFHAASQFKYAASETIWKLRIEKAVLDAVEKTRSEEAKRSAENPHNQGKVDALRIKLQDALNNNAAQEQTILDHKRLHIALQSKVEALRQELWPLQERWRAQQLHDVDEMQKLIAFYESERAYLYTKVFNLEVPLQVPERRINQPETALSTSSAPEANPSSEGISKQIQALANKSTFEKQIKREKLRSSKLTIKVITKLHYITTLEIQGMKMHDFDGGGKKKPNTKNTLKKAVTPIEEPPLLSEPQAALVEAELQVVDDVCVQNMLKETSWEDAPTTTHKKAVKMMVQKCISLLPKPGMYGLTPEFRKDREDCIEGLRSPLKMLHSATSRIQAQLEQSKKALLEKEETIVALPPISQLLPSDIAFFALSRGDESNATGLLSQEEYDSAQIAKKALTELLQTRPTIENLREYVDHLIAWNTATTTVTSRADCPRCNAANEPSECVSSKEEDIPQQDPSPATPATPAPVTPSPRPRSISTSKQRKKFDEKVEKCEDNSEPEIDSDDDDNYNDDDDSPTPLDEEVEDNDDNNNTKDTKPRSSKAKKRLQAMFEEGKPDDKKWKKLMSDMKREVSEAISAVEQPGLQLHHTVFALTKALRNMLEIPDSAVFVPRTKVNPKDKEKRLAVLFKHDNDTLKAYLNFLTRGDIKTSVLASARKDVFAKTQTAATSERFDTVLQTMTTVQRYLQRQEDTVGSALLKELGAHPETLLEQLTKGEDDERIKRWAERFVEGLKASEKADEERERELSLGDRQQDSKGTEGQAYLEMVQRHAKRFHERRGKGSAKESVAPDEPTTDPPEKALPESPKTETTIQEQTTRLNMLAKKAMSMFKAQSDPKDLTLGGAGLGGELPQIRNPPAEAAPAPAPSSSLARAVNALGKGAFSAEESIKRRTRINQMLKLPRLDHKPSREDIQKLTIGGCSANGM